MSEVEPGAVQALHVECDMKFTTFASLKQKFCEAIGICCRQEGKPTFPDVEEAQFKLAPGLILRDLKYLNDMPGVEIEDTDIQFFISETWNEIGKIYKNYEIHKDNLKPPIMKEIVGWFHAAEMSFHDLLFEINKRIEGLFG